MIRSMKVSREWFLCLGLLCFGTVACSPVERSVENEFKEGVFDPRPRMTALERERKSKPITRMNFLVFGDAKHSSHFKTVLKHADQLAPDFCLTTADLVQSGGGEKGDADYQQLEDEAAWFLRKYPTWPTVGNHEEAGGVDEGRRRFSNFFGIEKDLYAFEYGNAKFIALGWPKTHEDPKRLAWLEAELKSGQGKHLFIFQHRPYYTVGSKSKSDVDGAPNAATKLFERYHVTAVFAGHDHIYYRTQRNGVNYVISAGAGASIYELKRADDAIEGDVFYGRRVGKKGEYLFHDAEGKERDIPGPMHYVVAVSVDGPTVRLTMIDSTHKQAVWDDFLLTPSKP